MTDLPSELRFHEVASTEFAIGDVGVTVRSVPHIGPTNGYRVECDGVTVAYICRPPAAARRLPRRARRGARAVPTAPTSLIHDAAVHDRASSPRRPHWGHCTDEYAVAVATQAGARRLALFHHDPSHDDLMVDSILLEAREKLPRSFPLEIVAAAEGVTMSLGAVAASSR